MIRHRVSATIDADYRNPVLVTKDGVPNGLPSMIMCRDSHPLFAGLRSREAMLSIMGIFVRYSIHSH